MNPALSYRNRSIVVSRTLICFAVASALGSYFWQPVGAVFFIVDIVLRAYLHFVAGAMAHEGAHGHLGNSKSSNLWWTRFALVPTTVPAVTFRKTHLQHHAATNIAGKDPDEFLNTKRGWEIPFRALAMPHHWAVWLWKREKFTSSDRLEYAMTYIAYAAIYGFIASLVGVQRVLFGLFPAAILHSLFLWYFFAIKTHEGYSTGTPESRSHNYYGRLVYWLSCGLSMHRLHHLKPQLPWLQMASQVNKGTWVQRLHFARDVRRTASEAA